LKKAVQLLVKGNAVILEWVQSPIVYHADQRFVAEFLAWRIESGIAVCSPLTSQVPAAVRTFILGELADCDRVGATRSTKDNAAARRHPATFFREAITMYGPNSLAYARLRWRKSAASSRLAGHLPDHRRPVAKFVG
jgi:hypothetical protein